jgi:serine/threonine-protein kinase
MPEPTRIDKYEIIDEIGRGGFATVYQARDTVLDRIVALKVLHPYWTADAGFSERFRREARAAARLRHPNIVTVYETGEIDGQLYIAMEYLPGGTLRELLETEGVLTLEQALPILEQLAEALDYAHTEGVIHRDVKPGNVVVENTGRRVQVSLTDFGLVKAMEGSAALTSQGTLLGSPEYMAPEQADPERAGEIGPATDRYALGIVAYQILTGRVPFPGNTPGTLNAHEHKPVPSPRSIRPGLPQRVEAALLTMLAKAPEDRFDTATAFVARLRAAWQAETQARQRKQALAPLYRRMREAAGQQAWGRVLDLVARIQAVDPEYRDVAQWRERALRALQTPPSRRIPWRRSVGIGSLLALIVCAVSIFAVGPELFPSMWETYVTNSDEDQALLRAHQHADQARAATDPETARTYWESTLLELESAEMTAETIDLRQEAQAALDVINGVVWVEPVLVHEIDPEVVPRRLVVHEQSLFVLDAVEGAILRLKLNANREGVEGVETLVGSTNDVGDLIDMTWAGPEGNRTNDTLLALEDSQSLVEWNPAWSDPNEGPNRLYLGGMREQSDPVAIAVYEGLLYVLDPGTRQVWRYLPEGGGYPSSPEPYFAIAGPQSLESGKDMAIDGNVYILSAYGAVHKYYDGDRVPFTVSRVPEPEPAFVALAVNPEMIDQPIALADSSDGRIVVLEADGTFKHQLRAQDGAFDSLQAMALDSTTNSLFFIAGGRVYVTPMVTATSVSTLPIGIVAGHWGSDSGAICDGGLQEVYINLDIAERVVEMLRTEGYDAELLEEFDDRLEGYRAQALVSIHADSCLYPEASGFKVASVEDSTVPELEEELVNCLIDKYQTRTGLTFHVESITLDMTRYHTFYEIDSQTPGAIIDVGFMLADRDLLLNAPDQVAQGIVDGILCFVEVEPLQ